MQLRFDFDRVPVTPVATPAPLRVRRGAKAYQSGLMAEDGVARHYSDRGYALLAKRWRGKAGEIDLICRKGDCYVFVEVKSSSCLDRAAERITRRQMDRICLAACEFCGDLPSQLLTEMRFDAALVDQVGRVKVIENAFGEN